MKPPWPERKSLVPGRRTNAGKQTGNVQNPFHNRNRRVIILLAILFAAPLLAAVAMRITGWQPGATGNHGRLVEPPARLPAEAFPGELRGHWVLVAAVPSRCRRDCADLAGELLRVRRGLGKEAARVKLVLSGPEGLTGELRGAPLAAAPESLQSALGSTDVAMAPGTVLMIDPRGFLMMRYAPGFRSSGLLDDLERLLRYDRVGVQE